MPRVEKIRVNKTKKKGIIWKQVSKFLFWRVQFGWSSRKVSNWRNEVIDLFKEVSVGVTFFWKMAEILSKGILSVFNDRLGGCFGRGSAANFASSWTKTSEFEAKISALPRCCKRRGFPDSRRTPWKCRADPDLLKRSIGEAGVTLYKCSVFIPVAGITKVQCSTGNKKIFDAKRSIINYLLSRHMQQQ